MNQSVMRCAGSRHRRDTKEHVALCAKRKGTQGLDKTNRQLIEEDEGCSLRSEHDSRTGARQLLFQTPENIACMRRVELLALRDKRPNRAVGHRGTGRRAPVVLLRHKAHTEQRDQHGNWLDERVPSTP